VRVLKIFSAYVACFFYIFNPPFSGLPVSPVKIFWVLSFVYIIKHGKILFFINKFKYEILILIATTLLTIPVMLVNFNYAVHRLYLNVVFLIECFVASFYIINSFVGLNREGRLEKIIFWTAITSALISIILLLNPDWSVYVRVNVLKDELVNKYGLEGHLFRGFALAEGTTFSYGIACALIFIMMYKVKGYEFFYIPSLLMIFVSIILNARTGVVVVLYGLFVLALVDFKSTLKKAAIFFSMIFFVSYLVLLGDFSQYERTINWIADFVIELTTFTHGEAGGTIDVLTREMLFFPRSMAEIFFGAGVNVYEQYDPRSDVGYVNQIYFGGVLYLTALLVMVFFMWYRLAFARGQSLMAAIFFGSLLIVNFKGDSFNISTSFTRLISLYYVFYCLSTSRGGGVLSNAHFELKTPEADDK